MVELLWMDVLLLVVATVVAVLDRDVHWRSVPLGRPLYGILVFGGLGLLVAYVGREGAIPVPGWLLGLFALAYLPFLSARFVDLPTTDPRARRELEALLLTRDFRQLVHASDEVVLEEGRRKLRMHWEGRDEDGKLILELDVHPSLLPITVSRPHVAVVRDQLHLERIREDVRRLREAAGEAARHMSPAPPDGRNRLGS
ncbi:hypothetical protein K8I85_11440 [bacterium]|nr:hypothetical protein [bacterium]